ncbi:hypothetical protein MKK69_09205 [Methylobacterium sp. J-026]|jgi:hypothetical protein|uniref:hypothetical protein n=1 Tax=unclassified Methylobacterium TaxID=2615210 RepID=UPI0011C9757E|nr:MULTISPECIES: hypothetical protein [unclassified Methylobacterium]MCJ2134229.1 hypothetical protein [Methylobacterium sp. J-026]TXM71184.1 hypothetical protein FV229_00465 [Methylobacterium sp. WL120]
MRTLFLAAAVAAIATPSLAEDVTWLLPAPGFYCPIGENVMPIRIKEDGGMVIDSLDCGRVRLEGGQVLSPSCVTNGGDRVPYTTDLEVLPSGAMVHDGVTFRRRDGRPPCP